MIRGGINASNRPGAEAEGLFNENGTNYTLSEKTHERYITPTINLYLYKVLSKTQSIEIALDGSYRNTLYDRNYNENSFSALSHINEDFLSTKFTASYTIKLKHRNQITAQLHNYLKKSHADYAGDANGRQSLLSDETIFFVSYNQAVGKKIFYNISPGVSWINYNLHGFDAVNHVSPRLNLMLSYMPLKNHRLQLSVNLGNTYPMLSTMNTMYQQINRYKAVKGNPTLDNSILFSPTLTYNTNIKRIGITSSVSYFHADNAIVNSYMPDNDILLTSYADGYRQNTFTHNLGMSWRITDNLMIKLQGEYKHMNYLGATRTFVNAAKGYAQIDYTKGNFMLSLWGQTASKLLLNDMSETKSLPQFGIDLNWSQNNWGVELNINSPFLKDGKTRAYISTDYYVCNRSVINKAYQQNISLKVRYTFNFGKKTAQTKKYSSPKMETGIIKPE